MYKYHDTIQWSVQSIAASGLSREQRFYFYSSFTIQISLDRYAGNFIVHKGKNINH